MKRLSPILALTALVAATAALAQQSPSQAAPPAGSTPQQQSPPSSDPSPGMSSEGGHADKQALMKDCLTQVKAANPGVADKDIKAFCDREVNQSSPPQDR